MASEIKVNNIKDTCGTAVITKCGATHTVTAEVYKANTIQDTSGNAYLAKCGTTVTLGGCGQTIALAAGASQSGFGRSGSVNWNTTAITADPANAVSGTGYFANTTSAAFTITLPTSPSAGDIVAISDYASNFGTNNLTVGRNGSNIEGDASDYVLNQNGVSVTLVYVDGTKGWIVTNAGNSSQGFLSPFIVATGGTITTCGDCKIHTFTSPGTFTVSQAGTPAGSTTVDYMVVAGGGGGGSFVGGGGGAGGYRASGYGPSPLQGTALSLTATAFPITVGAGGSGGSAVGGAPSIGTSGSNSVFLTITSAGGGAGGPNGVVGVNGGSGGGGGGNTGIAGGSGNTPPTDPPQGNTGGISGGAPIYGGGGGGGATAVGSNGTTSAGGAGGAGAPNAILGSATTYAGGGGGGSRNPSPSASGGAGGGGAGSNNCSTATAGTVNTGGAGGGGGMNAGGCTGAAGGAGGSGIVIIRYKYQ